MMNHFRHYFKVSLIAIILLACQVSFSQKSEDLVFTTVKQLKATPVKNQSMSGTCWSFATVSFLESELIRLGKGEFDLSEMFFVHYVYIQKAISYVRLHGNANFGAGGQAHDVINGLRDYGAIPESIYTGLKPSEEKHDHGEMDAVLKAMVVAIAKQENVSVVWQSAIENVLDAYLGKIPASFDYKGKNYTPKNFAKDVIALNPDDYIEITSFTHHPFYKTFRLEVPDNWAFCNYYNVPLDDIITIIDYAIDKGYTVDWDGDVSEKEFSNSKGYARLGDTDVPDAERNGKEKKITPEMRQKAFDDYSTTDDHLMHFTGITKDQKGIKYYITKNSWGPSANDFGGYMNLSEQFVRYKTIAILLHKDAVPDDIAKKLGIK